MSLDFNSRNGLWTGESLRVALAECRVVIGGMGGLGWNVGAALVGLGVGKLVVFDPDALDSTNLNRMWGVGLGDVGVLKVDLFAARARSVNPQLHLACHARSVPCVELEQELASPCVMIGAFDKPEPRLACQIIARANGRTYIDVGVGFDAVAGAIVGQGQVFVGTSAGPCIVCAGLRLAAPDYFVPGGDLPEPSSAALNGVLSHLAVLTFLDVIRGRDTPPLRHFSAERHQLRELPVSRRRNCPICAARN